MCGGSERGGNGRVSFARVNTGRRRVESGRAGEGRLRSAGPRRVEDRPGIGGSKFSAHLMHNQMRGARGVVGDDTLEERGGDEQRQGGCADRRSREHRFGSIEVTRRRVRGVPPCDLRLCEVSEDEEMDLNAQDPANTLGLRANSEARAYTARSKPSPGFLGLGDWSCERSKTGRVPLFLFWASAIPGRARPPWPSRTSSRR